MASIADALGSGTLKWREVRGIRPGYDLVSGDETLATVRAGEIEIGDALYRTEGHVKGIVVLVDVRTGARVAQIRPMSHGPSVLKVYDARYRLSRRAVLPFFMEVTEDIAGPQVLQVLKVGSTMRLRAGRDLDGAKPSHVALLATLVGLQHLDLLAPSEQHTAA